MSLNLSLKIILSFIACFDIQFTKSHATILMLVGKSQNNLWWLKSNATDIIKAIFKTKC